MAIIKLQPGQKILLSVLAVAVVEGNYGPQLKFTGSTPDDEDATLFLNVEPATRQMERIGLNALSIVGQMVEVEKVDKNGQKFTNLNRVTVTPSTITAPRAIASQAKQGYTSGPHVPGLDAPRPIGTPEYGDEPAHHAAIDALKAGRLDALFTLYRTCLTEAVSASKAIPNATPEAIAAMTATLFIQANQRGIAA